MIKTLADALRAIAFRADVFIVCYPGKCKECDLLRELRDMATRALGELDQDVPEDTAPSVGLGQAV